MESNVKLQDAKKAIGIPDFKRDDLLEIALTKPSDLDRQYPSNHNNERDRRSKIYRRLAFLGDALLDSVLADYLFNIHKNYVGMDSLTKEEFDYCRQEILSKHSLTEFAIDLGLPKFSSSWCRKNGKSPQQEPRVWAEMFEALVGVIFIDQDKDFLQLSSWLVDNFLFILVGRYIQDPDLTGTITNEEFADMIGLPYYGGWLPGDDDD